MKTQHIITAALLTGTALFLGACATGKDCCSDAGACCSKDHKSHGAADTSATKHDHSAAASTKAEAPATVAAAKAYPLKTCIVSGKPLDSMGGEVRIVHQGQEIKFCCDSCQPKFVKNPEKYLPKLK